MRGNHPAVLSACLLALVTARLEAQNGSASARIAVDDEFQGHILSPNQRARFQVAIIGPDGGPAAARAVTFVGPEDGPGGSFDGAESTTPHLVRVLTNAQGIAEAQFRANDRLGGYLLTALLEGTLQVAHISVTNLPPGPVRALSAQAARRAVSAELKLGEPDKYLIGPVLLEPGAQVKPAAGAGRPFTTERWTWLFWVDDLPGEKFEHDTRFLFIDADDTDPRADKWQTTGQNWWPLIVLPGGRGAASLRAPLEANRELGHLSELPEPEIVSASARIRAGLQPPFSGTVQDEPNACAVIAIGSNERAMELDRAQMEKFFREVKMIPPDRILTSRNAAGEPVPTTTTSLEQLLAQAKAKGCSRLYVYISSHGAAGSICLWNRAQIYGESQYEYLSYASLGQLLLPFTQMGTDTVIILDACHTGTAINPLLQAGVKGTVITSTDRDKTTPGNGIWFGGLFTYRLIQGWQDPNADTNGDGQVDAEEATTWARTHYMVYANPQTGFLDGSGGYIKLNDIVIDLQTPSTNPATLSVPKPAGVSGVLDYDISLEAPGIASIGGQDFLHGKLAAGSGGPVTASITGLREGFTWARVRCVDDQGKEYYGFARVRVGGYQLQDTVITIVPNEVQITYMFRLPRLATANVRLSAVPFDGASGGVARVDPIDFLGTNDSAQIVVTGIAPGVARFRITDPRGVVQTLTVQVNGFVVEPDPIRVAVGQSVSFRIRRGGAISAGNTPLVEPVKPVAAGDAAIATVTSTATFPPGSDTATLIATGLKVGTANYQIDDVVNRLTKSFRVIVESRELKSTFDTDAEGWTCSNVPVQYRSSGGNPGGYLFVDNPETTISEMIAPPKFQGDLSAFDGGTLSFDGNMLQALDPPYTVELDNYGTITILSPNAPRGRIAVDVQMGAPPLNQWKTHKIDLTAASWGVSQEQWTKILSSVTGILVNIEAIFGREQEGFDNFVIRSK